MNQTFSRPLLARQLLALREDEKVVEHVNERERSERETRTAAVSGESSPAHKINEPSADVLGNLI